MKYQFLVIITLCISLNVSAQSENSPMATMVIQNGNIYTVNEDQPKVEYVATYGDRIVYVGNDSSAFLTAEDTKIIDLQGRTMTPGFIESHGHFMNFFFRRGAMNDNPLHFDLSEASSFEEIIERVEEAVQIAENGELIRGDGWHQDKWTELPEDTVKGMPVHDRLSAVSPDNPVSLGHKSGHAAMYNAYAMELGKIDSAKAANFNREQSAAEIVVDSEGVPTGVFLDGGYHLVGSNFPRSESPGFDKLIEWTISGMKYISKQGITGFHDMKGGFMVPIYEWVKQTGQLTVRMYVVLNGANKYSLEEWFEKGPQVYEDSHWIDVRSIKLMADGALGTYGAWLLEPYSDRPETIGLTDVPIKEIFQVSERALKNGFQIATHAIGDKANKEVLDIYEGLFDTYPELAKDHRWRIEHAQHLDSADIPRFGELGVIPSMQAIHLSSDRPWAIDRLGKQRIEEGAYVWQKLIKSGARIINGTDLPVEPLNPIANFYSSVSRKTLAGTPEGGYEPEQKMTRMQALESYTINPAYGSFMEDDKGSIEVGKLADFTIFDKDIMTIPEDEILDTNISMTIVGAKIVYDRNKEPEIESQK